MIINPYRFAGVSGDFFQDDFNNNVLDADKWTAYKIDDTSAALNETNGQIEITGVNSTAGQKFAGYKSFHHYDFTDKHVDMEIIQHFANQTSTNVELWLRLESFDNNDDYVAILERNNTLVFRYKLTTEQTLSGGANLTNFKKWRIAHSSVDNKFHIYTADSSGVWTLRYSSPTVDWSGGVAKTRIVFFGGTWNSATSVGTAIIDNIVTNIPNKTTSIGSFPSLPSGISFWAVYEAFREAGSGHGNRILPVDQSGNARHPSQSVHTSKPMFKALGLNNLPVYVFNGTSEWLDLPSMAALTELEAIYVMKATYTGGNISAADRSVLHTIGSFQTFPTAFDFYSDRNIYDNFGISNTRWAYNYGYNAVTRNLNLWHASGMSVSPSTPQRYYYRYNGVVVYQNNTANTIGFHSAPMIARGYPGSTSPNIFRYMQMELAAVYYMPPMDSTQRAAMTSYVNSIFGSIMS